MLYLAYERQADLFAWSATAARSALSALSRCSDEADGAPARQRRGLASCSRAPASPITGPPYGIDTRHASATARCR